ncbi:thioesterase family protein [Croceicoccus sp. BE223]|uniref:acyl-CoA thioesterase n=1 Tax=Croceicoccus sp. BE223 TaxID=2817716 RepID=UPI0028637220|nr:thioesterase family protein [Croceicoccus sp. BE223]MDR7102138.1 acyl-CoA thioester hydrolase [Croceicoccus sp. BE223]
MADAQTPDGGSRYRMTFVAGAEHIDFMGHVNNAVWLQWAQDIAGAHWAAVADPAHVDAYLWVVTRHEIDYRGNVGEGEEVMAETRIETPPSGARFERRIDFFAPGIDRPIVSVRSLWAMIGRASRRLVRIPPDVAAPFLD